MQFLRKRQVVFISKKVALSVKSECKGTAFFRHTQIASGVAKNTYAQLPVFSRVTHKYADFQSVNPKNRSLTLYLGELGNTQEVLFFLLKIFTKSYFSVNY